MGGPPRPLGASAGGADISPDGREIVFFRAIDNRVELVVASRDGSRHRSLLELPGGEYLTPRWSPEGKSLAFFRFGGTTTSMESELLPVPAEGGELRRIYRDANVIRGFAWLPDGSGFLYSSPQGNTIPYVPRVNLWSVRLDPRQALGRGAREARSYRELSRRAQLRTEAPRSSVLM